MSLSIRVDGLDPALPLRRGQGVGHGFGIAQKFDLGNCSGTLIRGFLGVCFDSFECLDEDTGQVFVVQISIREEIILANAKVASPGYESA